MRCPDCNKFVSNGDLEVEVEVEIDAAGLISGTAEVTLPCGECGQGLRQSQFDVDDASLVEAVAAHRKEVAEAFAFKAADARDCLLATPPHLREGMVELEDEEHDLEVESEGEEAIRTEGKGRGTKTFYGYRAMHTVTCSCGHEYGTVETSDDIQASSMDEM